MRYPFISLGIVCLLASFVLGCAPESEPGPATAEEPEVDLQAEGAAVREVLEQVQAAIESKDAEALTANYVESYETWNGETKGLAAYREYYADFLQSQKDVKWELEDEIGLVFVKPDVAIYKARSVFTDMLDDDGNKLPPQEYRHAWVLIKQDGRWLIAALFSAVEEGAA
jgi:uncharacterized protein (TIGR02246 family)